MLAFGAIWGAVNHPAAWLIVMALLIALSIWLLPKLWRGVVRVWRKIRSWFGGSPAHPDIQSTP